MKGDGRKMPKKTLRKPLSNKKEWAKDRFLASKRQGDRVTCRQQVSLEEEVHGQTMAHAPSCVRCELKRREEKRWMMTCR